MVVKVELDEKVKRYVEYNHFQSVHHVSSSQCTKGCLPEFSDKPIK